MDLVSLRPRAAAFLEACKARGWMVATAESCTGGLIAGLLTEIAGSSAVVECGFVTYSNGAKQRMLGIPDEMLAAHGAVSEPVARAMAEGARARGGVDLAVAVTGIAGPGGGTATKPVGLVHFGLARRNDQTRHLSAIFPGDREAVRVATVETALRLLEEAVAGS